MNKYFQNHKKIKILLVILIGLFLMGLEFGYILLNINSIKHYNSAIKTYNKLEKSNCIDDITEKNIDNEIKQISSYTIYYKKKEKLQKDFNNYKNYSSLKKEIDSYYDKDNIVKSTITLKKITEFNISNKKLKKKYQKEITNKITELTNSLNEMDSITTEINNIYNEDNTTIRDGITSEQVINIKNKLQTLPQKDIIEKYSAKLDNTIVTLQTKEQEEAERKRQEEIRNAWVILKVPYISQNHNNVLNGCEAASLLMGLQYKGYLQGMSLAQYATDMPKSSDPNQGFTYDIFGLDPRNVPHWIAPTPLAAFGRNSSGNPNVVDGTGMTLTQLDQEIMNGNPVVIYATAKFANVKQYIEGAPVNIHVQLLTGYNKITGEQIITDPWIYSDGKNSWTLSKSKLETIYNGVGQRSVIIR